MADSDSDSGDEGNQRSSGTEQVNDSGDGGKKRRRGKEQVNDSGDGGVRYQDKYLPSANVTRIMRKALPDDAKISKEAKETVVICVSEFIAFITSVATELSSRDEQKTIKGKHLLDSMEMLNFEYSDPLRLYLQKFRNWQDASGGETGCGGSASSSSSQPTNVLGKAGGNVTDGYGAGFYGAGVGGIGSGSSGMMSMDQQLYGGAAAGGGFASSSSSQLTDVLGEAGGNVTDGYGAGFYGTGAGATGSADSGMMVTGQQLYAGSPTSGSLYQHQQHQMGSGLFHGGGGGSVGSSSHSARPGYDDDIDQLLFELERDSVSAGGGAAGGTGSASSWSSQPTDVLWGAGGNISDDYAAVLYGTGADETGSGGSGMMVMGQQLYGGPSTSGSLYQHQQHQMESSLFHGGGGGGSVGGSCGSSSPSGRQGFDDYTDPTKLYVPESLEPEGDSQGAVGVAASGVGSASSSQPTDVIGEAGVNVSGDYGAGGTGSGGRSEAGSGGSSSP